MLLLFHLLAATQYKNCFQTMLSDKLFQPHTMLVNLQSWSEDEFAGNARGEEQHFLA